MGSAVTTTTPAAVRGSVRYRRIMRFAARHLARAWWCDLVLPRIGLGRIGERSRMARMQAFAREYASLARELGGLLIKVGQVLSSRLDILPPEVTAELASLQDEVPAVAFAELRALAEGELGMPLERAFVRVEEVPLAAASLGQVHRATLHAEDARIAGVTDVVVKIQRPGIAEIVDVDLAALRRVAGWLSRVRFVSDHADAPALVEEFASTTREELDYLHEARSADEFAARFADDPRVEAPVVVWERTSRRVLVLSDVTAIKINDIAALRSAGIDPKDVAAEFSRVMLQQFFVTGVFHADPHPGNVFVTPDADSWHLTFVDFGMIGEIPAATKRDLQRLVVAVVARDGRRIVELIDSLGALLPHADKARLETAFSAVFDQFGGMGFAELQKVDPEQFVQFASQFTDIMRAMPFQLPENLLFLMRAASLTSGVSSGLDPTFNVWDAIEPFATDQMRTGMGEILKQAATSLVDTLTVTAGLPRRIDALITTLDRGELQVATPQFDERLGRMERWARRGVSAVLFSGLLVGGVLLRPSDEVFGTVLMAVSVLPLGFTVLGDIFRGRGRSS